VKEKVIYLSLIILLFLLFPAKATAAGKVIILSLARLDLEQLTEAETISPWLEQGAMALLNTGTASGSIGRHLYVTMGAGSRALGTDSGRLAFMQDEDYNGSVAAQIYVRRQGSQPQGEIVHLGMAEIMRANENLQHPVYPGLLGETLHTNGKKTALIGNADGKTVNREAALLLADRHGQIDCGLISPEILKEDAMFPYGWRMHKEKVWSVFREVYAISDVILIDWGDTTRLNEYRPLMQENRAKQVEEQIFSDLDWLLTNIKTEMDKEDLLLLLAGVPVAGATGAQNLGFLLLLGASVDAGTLLISPTTRRPGLAAVIDLAPFILQSLNLEVPAEMIGRALEPAGTGGTKDLLGMRKVIDHIYRLRPVLLKTYVLLQIIFVLGALVNLFIRIIPCRYFNGLLLGLLTIPLLLLYLPLERLSQPFAVALTVFSAVAAVIVLQFLFKNAVSRFAALAVTTSVSLVVDVLRDAQLMKVSVLGYDPVSGARYYGLGNEYMGVLVGSAILGTTALLIIWPRYRRQLLAAMAVYYLGITYLMFSPHGGTNFGGTLTAVVAFIVTLAALLQIKPKGKTLLFLFTGLVLLAAVALQLNLSLPDNEQTHLGRTIILLQNHGWQALQEIVLRKGAMNLKLLRYSQWSRVFLAFLGVFAVLFFRPYGVVRKLRETYPAIAAGFLGIIAGSLTALCFNDSGVVAAATTLLYAGVPMIILVSQILRQAEIQVDINTNKVKDLT